MWKPQTFNHNSGSRPLVFSRVCESAPWNVKYMEGEKVESENMVFALIMPCSRICSKVLPSNSFSSVPGAVPKPHFLVPWQKMDEAFVLSSAVTVTQEGFVPLHWAFPVHHHFWLNWWSSSTRNQVSRQTPFCFAYKYSMVPRKKKTTSKESPSAAFPIRQIYCLTDHLPLKTLWREPIMLRVSSVRLFIRHAGQNVFQMCSSNYTGKESLERGRQHYAGCACFHCTT